MPQHALLKRLWPTYENEISAVRTCTWPYLVGNEVRINASPATCPGRSRATQDIVEAILVLLGSAEDILLVAVAIKHHTTGGILAVHKNCAKYGINGGYARPAAHHDEAPDSPLTAGYPAEPAAKILELAVRALKVDEVAERDRVQRLRHTAALLRRRVPVDLDQHVELALCARGRNGCVGAQDGLPRYRVAQAHS
ncbi:hypothetical protein RRF57_003757 [Xylaria bambusicola]|uniref:Uncharacterized protein n=1 Tax=Xylaria bambusicola TaxID=326684 RepID=A0AAN7Z3Q5_9PEZI